MTMTADFRVEILDPTSHDVRWVGNGKLFGTLSEAWAYGHDLLGRWSLPLRFRVMRASDDAPWAMSACPTCPSYVAGELAPSHMGSPSCKSGSLASGGNRAHCTCDGCF